MDWLERIAKLRQWTRSGTRAPHKPLLLLHALGRFQQDPHSELRYSAVEEELRLLLSEYGPPNRTTPAYPFHHLVSDGVWEVRTAHGPGSPGSGVRDLRETGATGRLAPELRIALRREPELLGRIARLLLDLHFPPSLHGELRELELNAKSWPRGRRRGAGAAVRRGSSAGGDRTWEQLIDVSPEPALPSEDGYLEAATTDTYLAVEQTALDLDEE